MTRIDRRTFLTVAGAAAALGARTPHLCAQAAPGMPALLGGTPVRTAPFPSWPVSDAVEDRALAGVLQSGRWNRGSRVDAFEREYAALTGAAHCLACANGTSALLAALAVLDVGPGDEVIVPPYTFVATINVVLQRHALPVFVDTDIETFQIDARRIEAAITPRTRVIIPVHLGGSAADLDTILAIGRARNIPVLEDACQAHLGEWRGRKVGSLGIAGAFSFQASKNLNCGEGGALITSDATLADTAYAFHNNSTPRGGGGFAYRGPGLNLRLTDFQAAILSSQMTRLAAQAAVRDENGAYLTGQLSEIDGIAPARMYPGCTRNAYHLYMFRYDPAAFGGLPRAGFLRALRAEGVPASGGYTPLNTSAGVTETLASRSYVSIYGKERLAALAERNACPANDRLCQEAVWLTQNVLLGSRSDMDDIVGAVRKVQAHGAALARAPR
ncbi:MAG TPA: DegT/DnrJ/EryC1/StrS family aminotransferase [Vicinamibacterales bacterium]|nr:DegT/DnrJ/EryC1/StrS family aminotransferase [Vicinamibacterales bacterium]